MHFIDNFGPFPIFRCSTVILTGLTALLSHKTCSFRSLSLDKSMKIQYLIRTWKMNGYNFVNNSETRLLESYAELPIRHLSSLKQVIQYVWYYIASWSQNSQKVMNHSNLTKSEKNCFIPTKKFSGIRWRTTTDFFLRLLY